MKPKYDDEFKKSIVSLYQTSNSQSQLSRKYCVSIYAITRWIKQFSEVKLDDNISFLLSKSKNFRKEMLFLRKKI